MKLIILGSYVKSSLHVALSLWAFCNVLALQQGVDLTISLQCAIFGSGLAAYKYTNQFVPLLYKRQSVSVGNIALFFVALALGFWGLMAQPLNVWWLFFGIAVLTFCYALPFGAHMGLRFVPMLKVFVVAFSWTTMALLPLISLPKQMFVWVAAKSVLWILCLMLPFELRDLHKDPPSLKTVPQLLGISRTKTLGYVLLCGIAFLVYQTVQITALFCLEIVMLLLLGLAIKASPKHSETFTSFWVEGIPILWFLVSSFIFL
jgi:hypothetical protein